MRPIIETERYDPFAPQHDGQLVLAPAGIARPRLADGRPPAPPSRSDADTAAGATNDSLKEGELLRDHSAAATGSTWSGRCRSGDRWPPRSGSARSPGSSAAAWPPGSTRGHGQAGGLPWHPIAQAQTRATADPLKLTTARLAHEGTSSDLGDWQTHQAGGYVPSSLPFTGAVLSERDQGARQVSG